MICPRCRRDVPDALLGCVGCIEERSKPAIRQSQQHPLRLVAQGRGTFTTRAIGSVRHVQMFGGIERTFCGEQIVSGHKRGAQSFQSLNDSATFICSKCREEIAAILREAEACSASQ